MQDKIQSKLQAYKGNREVLLGECELDLANYGKPTAITERLTLENCAYDGAYIEIVVKSKSDMQGMPTTPGLNRFSARQYQ